MFMGNANFNRHPEGSGGNWQISLILENSNFLPIAHCLLPFAYCFLNARPYFCANFSNSCKEPGNQEEFGGWYSSLQLPS